jgi:nucleoside-diphosphate-sugar epimerase
MPRAPGVGPYSRTKRAAEELALDYHALGRVPVSVVRPGNVYGPGSGLWVDEVARNLRRGLVPLIDGGDGDASMAYVDNVVDLIVRAAETELAAGRIYNANDGSGTTWRRYFGDLARIIGARPPTLAVGRRWAMRAATAMEASWRLGRLPGRPLLTREAVMLLQSRARVPIDRARRDLGHEPLVTYGQAMEQVSRYLRDGT